MDAKDYEYIAIDMKSFYASIECVQRKLDPLKANLLVADESRSDQTICLAVSPALKAIGVPSRPRLFEAKRAIENYEKAHNTRIEYICAVPQMRKYEEVAAQIYSIMLRYASADDIHIYSIDESFIYCRPYMHIYKDEAAKDGVSPAHRMAVTLIRDILSTTGITATAGIGTNLYLAKIAMDIVAKKKTPDSDGVRIAELDEKSYRLMLWEHRPLTDFWHIGPGKARRLEKNFMFTMGDIARRTQYDEEWFYKEFGIDAEILIDHAWGIETAGMADIKSYRPLSKSLSSGQVLSRPYRYTEARIVFREMLEELCMEMYSKDLVCSSFVWYVSYDHKSLEANPGYSGPLALDFYGRLHPCHSNGTVRLKTRSPSFDIAAKSVMPSFDQRVDHSLLFRRLNISASGISEIPESFQFDLFNRPADAIREKKITKAMLEIRKAYGAAAVFKCSSLLGPATALERSRQIGGHRK